MFNSIAPIKPAGNQKIRSAQLRLAGLALLLLLSMSCNFVTQAILPATPTLTSSPTPKASLTPRPTLTAVPSLTPTPAATLLSEGLYIPQGCQGTPVATISPEKVNPLPTAQLAPDLEIPKELQLRVFEQLTGTISQVYLYPDYNGVDWAGLVSKARAKIKVGLSTADFYTEMTDLVQALGDEHSSFQSPAVVQVLDKELSGQSDFVGIGVQFETLLEKKSIAILAVFPDSPAEHAGLKPHDVILAVDGKSVIENGKAAVWRVRGTPCSAAVLTVQSPGQSPRDVLLVRYRITSALPVEARLVTTQDGSRIGYIFLPSFFDETIPAQVRKALEDFGKLDGLIIDNRINTGGSSDVVVPILSFFTHGNLGATVSRTERSELVVKADPINNSQDVPMVVLVGEGTVSFGEIFSGILQDIGRAKVAGKTSLGNVEILSQFSFADRSRAWIAQNRFDPKVSHANWEKDGIIPDLPGYAEWDTFTFATDPGVAAALKLLGHK